MSKKIILCGATGYTGRNTAEAAVKRGLKPLNSSIRSVLGLSISSMERLPNSAGRGARA